MARVYGAPVSLLAPGSDTWQSLHQRSGHVNWCAVDWTDPERKFMIAQPHRGPQAIVSRDGGKSFQDLTAGPLAAAWVFDNRTAVVAMDSPDHPKRLLRTTDAGQNFAPCGDYPSRGLPRWRDGTLYWLVNKAMIATRDKGQTWQEVCKLADPLCGPIFGAHAKHLFVLGEGGIVESTDGGASWSKPEPIPQPVRGSPALTWVDYDPINDLLYVMKMTSDLYQMARAREP
jgi:photosystem II stability/assembly factor-like uncharacterized protein